jgi:ribosomal protection tetracycline resistance protein
VRTLNLGIVAHVDAGKTSLTERLLFAAGVIDRIGSVDDGNTTTDSLALERRRGITIKSAVVSFALGEVTVNLIDTPGHPDFIAEVERVLSVLDGAVLVVSAVEGVQPQTRVLMRTLRRLSIPVLIFINKTDRAGADVPWVLREMRSRLTPCAVRPGDDDVLEILAEHDDDLLAAFVDGTRLPAERVARALARAARRGLVYPVLSGSAVTGSGTDALGAAITEFLPCSRGDADAPLDGYVFKIERDEAGAKVAYVRIFDGTLRVRDRVVCGDRDVAVKVTGVSVTGAGSAASAGLAPGAGVEADGARTGQIARVRGLHDARIGDTVRAPEAKPGERANAGGLFAPPTLETAVLPVSGTDRVALHAALAQLTEQDPLIGLRRGDDGEIFLSLFGEVQKEVIETTLAEEFALAVTFEETTTICVERVTGTGESAERIKTGDNPFLAGVGLRVSPLDADAVRFRLEVSPGAMPPAFFAAVEDTVRATLRQGLHGWQVTGCLVTMTHSGYCPRQSHAHQKFNKAMSSTGADFRGVTPLAVMGALRQAGTAVCEPLHHFGVEIPAERSEATLTALPRFAAVPLVTTDRGATCLVEGSIPAASVGALQRELPSLTGGEGVLETTFDRYVPVYGHGADIPSRRRTGPDPLDRKEYLLRVTRRI